MRILLDEQLPRQLAPYFVGHAVRTVHQEGWAGVENGALLTKAEDASYEVLVTGDKNMQFQQNIAKRKLGVFCFTLCPMHWQRCQRFKPARWSELRPGQGLP